MIEYKITLDKIDNEYVYLIFELKFLGYPIKFSKIALIKSLKEPSWSEKIDFATYIAQKISDNLIKED